MPATPIGPWDWKPTPTGKIILDFLNGKMPGYVETGLNFVGVEQCAAGHLLAAEKGKIGQRYLLGGENLTLKAMLDLLSKITGLPSPKLKIPHGLALGVAYANTVFSRLLGREPGIPVEGVKIARHMMFVDCSRAQRELGFKPEPVSVALERAVRWYEANDYVLPHRAKRMARARARVAAA
jgi:dihydroflavonol-4-reductase